MNFRYSRSYYPPVPVVEVTFISAADNLHIGPVSAIVDSGADGTLVPQSYLDQINAPSTTDMLIRSQWGEPHQVVMYLVDVRIGNLTLPGIEVVGDTRSEETVLGRDVLNRLQVLLNGPRETVNVLE